MPTKKPTNGERLAKIETLLEVNNTNTSELLKIIKGNGTIEGLMTKVSKNQSSIRNLKWGFRTIMSGIVGAFIWFIRG